MSIELSWNDLRDLQMKQVMDALQDRSTGTLTDEKVAKMCKDDIAEHGPNRHIKRSWKDFAQQQPTKGKTCQTYS